MAIEIAAALKEAGAVAKDVVQKTGEAAIEKGKQVTKKIKGMSETDITETAGKTLEDIKNAGDGVLNKLEDIKNLTPEQLREKIEQNIEDAKNRMSENTDESSEGSNAAQENTHDGLTDEEKAKVKEETGWSDEIINHIESMEQYEIYKNADLHEGEVNGRKCLLKDIDLDYVDPKTGMTNRELMAKGRPPIDSKTGERIELHHMGQDYDSPFAELCENSEHGDGNDTILHDKTVDSWRNNPELKNKYNNSDRPNHWKNRVTEG